MTRPATMTPSTAAGTRQRRLAPVALAVLLSGAMLPHAPAQEPPGAGELDPDRPVIELALCFDTSGSMEASIDAARVHLWGIVDDLARIEPTPRVRVALLTYGSIHNPKESGWVRVQSPLTSDLDSVSRALFDLETGGATEYVARVVQTAIEDLDWSDVDGALRMVFVIGNEEADQDPEVDANDLAGEAEDRDVAVHPVFVGGRAGRNYETWRVLGEALGVEVAALRPGKRPDGPESPVDKELASLGKQLSSTYVPFGENGVEAAENQKAQDDNVEALGVSVAASRAITKAGPLYEGDWDLVDAVASGRVVIDDVPAEDLPPAMRSMTMIEREEYLFDLAERRGELKQRIRALGGEREQYLEAKRSTGVRTAGDDLRSLVRRTVRDRAEGRGIEF